MQSLNKAEWGEIQPKNKADGELKPVDQASFLHGHC